MTAPIRPASSKAYGNEKWAFVPVLTTPDAPKITEVTGATALDVSCYLFDDSARPSKNTNTVEKKRRICDTATFQQIGSTTYSGGELSYAADPQAAAGSDGKKAAEKMVGGSTGWLVRRLGKDVNTDFAIGDFLDAFPVELGPQFWTTVGDGEAAENGIAQTFVVTSAPSQNKAAVA